MKETRISIGFALLFFVILGDTSTGRDGLRIEGVDGEVVRLSQNENRGFSLLDIKVRNLEENAASFFDPKRHRLIINGGYFNPDFSPTGYCKIDGRVLNPKRPKSLSGFVAIDERGAVSLLTRHDDLSKFPTVLQSGPFLIDPGGRIGIRSRVGIEAYRTAIGRTSDDELIILVTAPIDLFDLAVAAKRAIPTLERLLNLDGGPSTALVMRDTRIVNAAPVRNYLIQAAD